MDEYLHIRRFEHPPSASDFESLIEPRNVPAVFQGCTKDWGAFSMWNPYNGGLDYLEECAGSCIVEAMLTRSASVFYGDLRSHERIPLPFSTFIQFCKQHLQERHEGYVVSSKSNTNSMIDRDLEKSCFAFEEDPQKLYLAQVPIFDNKNEERVQLEPLMKDIQTPAFLEKISLASSNLWMNSSQCRSSTHYDPHHNVLCIVSGSKQVILWPPSASPTLYPMQIYGEASNHSSLTLEKPDYSLYPRAQHSMKISRTVILHAGDALFIPEGWYHQVDSGDLTIAVNFWWQSPLVSSMSEHMDAYYLRIILRRLMDKEMNLEEVPKSSHYYNHRSLLLEKNQVLQLPSSSAEMVEMKIDKHDMPNTGEMDHSVGPVGCLNQAHEGGDLREKELTQKSFIHVLEPCAAQALYGLITLVHDHVSVSDQSRTLQSSSRNGSAAFIKDDEEGPKMTNLHSLENDQVANLIWKTEPLVLRKVLLTMANNFPRTLEAFILHLLSPVGAEVLTRKFDEMDQSTSKDDQKRFYDAFYSSFDDQSAVMEAILNGKECFALQAFKNVMDKYLAVNLNGLNLGS